MILQKNFHLKPSRVLHRVSAATAIPGLFIDRHFISFKEKKILLLDSAFSVSAGQYKCDIDLVVISKNPKLHITNLVKSFNIKEIVFDGSVATWKLTYWKKDCDSLHIPYYDVSEKGAFVMNLN